MQDGDIASIEFHKVLQKVEKYRKPMADIRKVKEITKEKGLKLPEHDRKEGKSANTI